MNFCRAIITCSSLALCSVSSAAQIELENGDRITAEITGKEPGILHVKSAVLGNIDIKMSDIAHVIDDSPVVINEPPPADAQAPNSPAAFKPAPVATAPAKAKQSIAAKAQRHSILATFRRVRDSLITNSWKSNLRFGYSLISGETDSSSTNLSFATEHKWKKSEVKFTYAQDYATAADDYGNETVTSDKLKMTGRYRYNMNKIIFFQSETQAGYARVNGIDQNYLHSFGYGFNIVQNKLWDFTLTPSLSAQYQVVDGISQDVAFAPTMYQEAQYKWTDTLKIRNEAYAVFPANDNNSSPTYHFAIIFQNKIVKNLSLNWEYVFDFDGAVKEEKNAAQHNLRLALGMDF